MKVLCLGSAGKISRESVNDLVEFSDFDKITVADCNEAVGREVVNWLNDPRVDFKKVDVHHQQATLTPMQDEIDYKSRIDGRVHTCGHDVHTATLIGAARVISAMKSRLNRNVRFIFQPNEENMPGGAPAMIADGALANVDEIYALHVWPPLEAGQYALCSDAAFSRRDRFEI